MTVHERVASAALAAHPVGPAGLREAVAGALRDEHLAGGRAERLRAAGQVALLARLLSDGPGPGAGADPVPGLARHVRFVLEAPAGNPLVQDLQRLTAVLDDLGSTLRSQRRTARLRSGGAARVRGTEAVMARAMAAFTETWQQPHDSGDQPPTSTRQRGALSPTSPSTGA